MGEFGDYEDGDVNTVDTSRGGDPAEDLGYGPGDVNTVGSVSTTDGDDDELQEANREGSGLSEAVLTYLARSLTGEPDEVVVRTEERRGTTVLRLSVAQGDMGRVIGRRGRTAQAIRTLVGVAGARDGVQTSVDIVDD